FYWHLHEGCPTHDSSRQLGHLTHEAIPTERYRASLGFENLPAIDRLDAPSISGIQLGECRPLRIRNSQRVLHYVPCHSLRTRRRGKRTRKRVIPIGRRKQVLCVDIYSRNIECLPLLCREILPDRPYQCIRIALRQENGYHSQMTFGIRVNQVGHHIIAVPIYLLLAWMVKMKLLQRVNLFPNS